MRPSNIGRHLNRRVLLSIGLILLVGSLLIPPTSRRVFSLSQTGNSEYVTDEVGRLTILAPAWAPNAGAAVFFLTRFARMPGAFITESVGPFAWLFWIFVELPIIAAVAIFIAYKARGTSVRVPYTLRVALVPVVLSFLIAPKYRHDSVTFGPIWSDDSLYGILVIEWLIIILVASIRGMHKTVGRIAPENASDSGTS